MSAPLTLDALADHPRWVGWRNERDNNGRVTKVPFTPGSLSKAMANNPATWRPRREAEEWARQHVNGQGGGVGIELGDLGGDISLGGVDLDKCRASDGAIAPWAMEVIQRLGTYAEVSPSGTGLKTYFLYTTADLPALRQAMGTQHGKAWSRGGGDHPPAIELHLGHKYFATTDEKLPDSAAQFRLVPLDTLLWVICQAGPAFVGKSEKPQTEKSGHDSSRSAAALRLGARLRRTGKTFEEMVAALHADSATAEWSREKGAAYGGREFRRIWDRAGAPEWLDRAQRNEDGAPRSNLANALLALREAPELRDLFAYDEMLRAPLLMKPIPGRDTTSLPRPLRDDDVTAVQEWLQIAGLPLVSRDTAHQAVSLRTSERAFHPVRDYLNV